MVTFAGMRSVGCEAKIEEEEFIVAYACSRSYEHSTTFVPGSIYTLGSPLSEQYERVKNSSRALSKVN